MPNRRSDRYRRRNVLQIVLCLWLLLAAVTPVLAQDDAEQTNGAHKLFLPLLQNDAGAALDGATTDRAQNLIAEEATAVVEQAAAADATVSAAALVTNNPPVAPISILAFPQRDFVSAAGYNADDLVVVKLIHPNGVTLSTDPANPIAPQPDPLALPGDPFAGIVEVNHPGGACWFGTTPDIRPGDVVQIDIVGGPRAGQRADATTVANVVAQRPVQVSPTSVQIHGTAQTAAGTPIPIAQLEQRLVAPKDQFDLNGRRTLRAPGDGALAYDAPGSLNWTATYVGLTAADVTRALNAESRGLWLGADPLAAVEGTIYEIGAGIVGGPQAPCTAPLEILPPPPGSELIPPSTPTNLAAAVVKANTVNLSWTAATDNVGVTSYGVYRDGIQIANVQNADASAPAPTSYADKNVPPGTYTYQVDAADAVGNRSGLSNGTTVTTAAQPAANLPANQPPVAPVQIIGFPARDFISSMGFLASDTVDVEIIRNGFIVSTASGLIPQQDPLAGPNDPFAGIVEVNHPGGFCWEGVTPDLRPGDIIRTIAFGVGNSIRTVDQTTIAGVTAQRPIATGPSTVVIHGTAQDTAGLPLPIDQIEERLVVGRDRFDRNGRRTLRAGAGIGFDGVLAYDAPGSINWTATYTGLSSNDVTRAVGGTTTAGQSFPGAESRILWLGSNPVAGTELTIYENGPAVLGGPSVPPCTAPSEVPTALIDITPLTLNFGNVAPPTTSAVQNVTLRNIGAAAMTINAVYLAGLNPADYLISSNNCPATLAAGLSCTVGVAFRPTVLGTRQATLSFMDNASNTTDQSVQLTGAGASNVVTPGAPTQTFIAGSSLVIQAANIGNSTIPVNVNWAATPSAITAYQVQQSVNNGAFVDTATQPGLATNLTLSLAMGTTTAPNLYQFRVRACNNLDCSAWATGFAFSTLPIDQANTAFVSFNGTWTTQTIASAYGGTRRFSNTTNSFAQIPSGKVTLTVPGRIAFIAVMQSDSGRALISIDGGAAVTVDLYSAAQQFGKVVFVSNQLAAGSHSIKVTVAGTHQAASSGNFVDVDAFVFMK